jgi:hypothetical protein
MALFFITDNSLPCVTNSRHVTAVQTSKSFLRILLQSYFSSGFRSLIIAMRGPRDFVGALTVGTDGGMDVLPAMTGVIGNMGLAGASGAVFGEA